MAKGGQRQRVGAKINAVVAETHRERRAAPRADEQIEFAVEQKNQREGALEPPQRRRHRLARLGALAHFLGDEMRDDLGVRLGGEDMALGGQLLAQLAEILDNAVMDHRDLVVGVRVRVVFVGAAMRRPAGVAEADVAGQRQLFEFILQIAQLAAGAQPRQPAIFQRGDARPNHSRDIPDASARR